MGIKKLRFMGVLVLILIFIQFAVAYRSQGFEVRNLRVGTNVFVPADETVSGGLVAAGANVEVSGDVKEGLKAFGANVVVPGDIQGELIAIGANVVLSGKYHNKVKGGAANLILSGTFDDNVEVGGARIIITPTAFIKGDLIYRSAVLDRQKGSRIMGKVTHKKIKVRKERIEAWGEKGKKVLFSLGIIFYILSIPALIIVGLLINYFFPKKTDEIVNTISQSPWKSLGVGLVFLVVVPVGIIISFITVVGVPAGIIAGLLYGIALYISRIYIGVWIGRKLLGYIKKSLSTAFFWPLVVGTIIISLVTLIPFVGWLFRLFLLLISLGAMWVVVWRSIPLKREG